MSDPPRKRRQPSKIQLFTFVAIILVVVFAFAHKVSAQGGGGAARGGGGGATAAAAKLAPKPGEKIDPKKPGAKEEPAAEEPKKEEAKKEEKKDGEEEETAEHVKEAVAGPDGGVPIHKDGDFRSPFANPKHGHTRVKVGFLLETVEEYDIKKGSFTAHFFVSFTSDRPMPKIDLQATNGKLEDRETLADLPTFKMWKFGGTFHEPPDLHAYPFDTQELVIELEDDSNGSDALRLVADVDHTFLDATFDVPGWDVDHIRARILNHYYPDRFENDDLYYSRYKFTLGIKRFATSAVFTVFMPALVIVMISLSGLWFPRDELEVRSNATTPMLAAAVLFHFALMQELPATAYLSRADKLMMGVYACLFLHMLSSWIWFVVDEKHTETLFRWAKYICAPLTFLIMGLGILL